MIDLQERVCVAGQEKDSDVELRSTEAIFGFRDDGRRAWDTRYFFIVDLEGLWQRGRESESRSSWIREKGEVVGRNRRSVR